MKRLFPFVVPFLALCCSSAAFADMSSFPLRAGGLGTIPGFAGTVPFVASGFSTEVDFAVWAPGDYPFSTAGITPLAGTFDPGAFVYAYQIHNSDSSTFGITALGIDSAGGVMAGIAYDLLVDTAMDDIAPSGGVLLPAFSAEYVFGAVPPDGFSSVLLLSSPDGPAFAAATVIDGGVDADGQLPSPVPAPGAAMLGLIGCGILACFKRRV